MRLKTRSELDYPDTPFILNFIDTPSNKKSPTRNKTDEALLPTDQQVLNLCGREIPFPIPAASPPADVPCYLLLGGAVL